MTKHGCLAEAVKITQEYARSDVAKGDTAIVSVLESVYDSLKKLSEDADK